MKSYSFDEARPLKEFIEANKDKIVGHILSRLHVEYWPEYNRCHISDMPVVLELENYCIVVYYLIPSDIEIIVGMKDEVSQNKDVAYVFDTGKEVVDYYSEEFKTGINKELIENCTIKEIEIQCFSKAFECNPCTGEMRPEGGDYFSTIRLHLDSGVILCFCGAESILDGYIEVWCE